uniref:Secreted protein n=1 Tax=Mesocestoides corti TaxID=53468 RepID=A0A5K3G0Z4_MESCO
MLQQYFFCLLSGLTLISVSQHQRISSHLCFELIDRTVDTLRSIHEVLLMKVEDTADPQSRNATLRDIKTCVDLIKACNSALNEIALTDHSCGDPMASSRKH